MSMHKGILGQKESGASVKQDTTLRDYVGRKCENEDKQLLSSACEWPFPTVAVQKKKLTFDQWWSKPWTTNHGKCDYRTAQLIWKAAQENM